MTEPTPELLEKLMHVSTATLTTALFKRGFRNVFIQGPYRMNPGSNMVGPAYTLRYIPAREDLDGLESFADRANPQRKGVEECPRVRLHDRLAARFNGCVGGVYSGHPVDEARLQGDRHRRGFRDTPEISALEMPAYHTRPSAPTNLTKHHAVAINDPIACGGVSVFPGDIIVGDNEGVVCIPKHLVAEIASETEEMTVFEDFVLEMVQNGASIFGLYPPTDPATKDEFKAWREQNNR